MALTGWVATHTGLPSFYVTGSGRLTADHLIAGASAPRLVAVSDGVLLVSDAGAAPGVATTYRFGSDSVVLTRRGAGAGVVASGALSALTTSDGVVVADVAVMGDDERSYDTDAEVFTSALGRQIPRYRLGLSPARGTVEVATVGAGTFTLRDLVAARSPLWLLHDSGQCQIPGCDIEGARLIVPHRMRESRSPRRDVAQRNWEISYTRVPDSLVGGVQVASGVPVVTWGQWETWAKTNSPKGWQNWSEIQVCQRIAGMPQV